MVSYNIMVRNYYIAGSLFYGMGLQNERQFLMMIRVYYINSRLFNGEFIKIKIALLSRDISILLTKIHVVFNKKSVTLPEPQFS